MTKIRGFWCWKAEISWWGSGYSHIRLIHKKDCTKIRKILLGSIPEGMNVFRLYLDVDDLDSWKTSKYYHTSTTSCSGSSVTILWTSIFFYASPLMEQNTLALSRTYVMRGRTSAKLNSCWKKTRETHGPLELKCMLNLMKPGWNLISFL